MIKPLALFFLLNLGLNTAIAHNDKVYCLLSVYPTLKWDKQSAKIITATHQSIPWAPQKHKSFQQKLKSATIGDTLSMPYNRSSATHIIPPHNHDPGRMRNTKLLAALYGQTKAAIKANLVRVQWIQYQGRIRTLFFNRKQGAAEALRKVVKALNKLSNREKAYLSPSGGSFNYRKIAGTNRLSAHSYGIAIDINTKKSLYWRWSKQKTRHYSKQIPTRIIKIFEKHGFIWGGRWHHYDTMHFEYRPEIIQCTELQ